MGSFAHMAGNSIRVETKLAAWWILSIDMYCLFAQCFWKIESKDWKISCSSPEYLACLEIGCMWPVSAHSRRWAGAGQWLSHSSWPWCPQTKQNKTWTCALEPTSFTLVNSLPSYRGHWSLWPLPGFPDLIEAFTTIVVAEMGLGVFCYFLTAQHEVFMTVMALGSSLEFSYWDSWEDQLE